MLVQEMEENVVVEIKDDNAFLRDYNTLLDKLEEMEMDYIENIQSETK